MWQASVARAPLLNIHGARLNPSLALQKKDFEQMPLTNYRMTKYVGSGRYGGQPLPTLPSRRFPPVPALQRLFAGIVGRANHCFTGQDICVKQVIASRA
jgi:hypothetical protein